MVKFINATGGIMYVHESREAEYKAAGYKPVAASAAQKKTDDAEPVKKTTSKKKKEEV